MQSPPPSPTPPATVHKREVLGLGRQRLETPASYCLGWLIKTTIVCTFFAKDPPLLSLLRCASHLVKESKQT